MKKLLNIFASLSLITTGASSVVACGSHHNPSPPTPPKSESQKLYNQLNNQTFPIQDNNFWGNEATYKQDLLTDLEKAANITSQEDKNLLHDVNVKPLTQRDGQSVDVQSVDINIDGIKDPAIVKIKWELTTSQKTPGLFKFYTQTWPQEISKLNPKGEPWQPSNNFIPILFWGWYGKQPSISISWNTKVDLNTTFQQYLQEIFENLIKVVPPSLKSLIKLDSPVSIPKVNINEVYTIPIDDIYISSNGVKYPLSSYTSYDPTKALPKMQNWQISYDTFHNLLHNELNNPKQIWGIGSIDPISSKASDHGNTQQILGALSGSKFEPLTTNLTFTGNLKSGVVVPIEVYYNKADLGFPIYVYGE